jgi:hypothetical protein
MVKYLNRNFAGRQTSSLAAAGLQAMADQAFNADGVSYEEEHFYDSCGDFWC